MHLKEMYEMYEVQLLVFHRVLIKKNPFNGGGMDIYRTAMRRDKYPTLATKTAVNSCFSIY